MNTNNHSSENPMGAGSSVSTGGALPHVVSIKQWIDTRKVSAGQWFLLALCFAVAVLDGLDAAIMGFVAPSLMKEWSIAPGAFGSVMGAAMFGLAVGSIGVGPLADRFGRKRTLIFSTFCFGLFSAACAFSHSIDQLVIFRFLTGIGLGGAMPIANILLCEYLPSRSRGFLMTVMYTGFNLGSGSGGFVSAWLIPSHGWQGTLLFGGVVPLLLVPLLLLFLPESVRFLSLRRGNDEKIAGVLRRYGGHFEPGTRFVAGEEQAVARSSVSGLFRKGYLPVTASLWATNFMGLLVIYLLTSWLPTLLHSRGIELEQAAVVTAMFQIGGTVGALLVGWLMDRQVPRRVIAGAYVLGAVSIVMLGAFGLAGSGLMLLVTAAGFCMSGAQTGLNAHAPTLYPTWMRGTGVSWMLGFGRFGAIVGSSIGGVLLMAMGSGSSVVGLLGLPAVIAGLSILGARRSAGTDDGDEEPLPALDTNAEAAGHSRA